MVAEAEVRVEAGEEEAGRPVVRLHQQEANTERQLERRERRVLQEDRGLAWSTFTRPSTRSSRTTEAFIEKRRRLRHIPRKEIKLIRIIAFTLVKQSSDKTFFFRLKLKR